MQIGIEIAKACHVGAIPRLTLLISTCGLRISTAPMITSSACVARSASERKMLSLADSWIPRMLSSASSTQSVAATTTWPTVPERMNPQPGKTDRYGGTVYAEIAIVTV